MDLDELFGEMLRPVRDRRLCASGILLCFLSFSSREIREDPEDDGDRSEREGLLAEDLRDPFLRSVGRSKELEWERKKVATRWGILRVFEAKPKCGGNASIGKYDDGGINSLSFPEH